MKSSTISLICMGFSCFVADAQEGPLRLLRDFEPASRKVEGNHLTNAAGGLVFRMSGTGREGIWRSDGISDQVSRIHSAAPEPGWNGTSADQRLFSVGNTVVFRSRTEATGLELWRTDGTVQGTSLLKDIYPGSSSGDPSRFALFNNELYFTATTLEHGTELWHTDGTPEGTHVVKDINPGITSSLPADLVAWNGFLYFTADDGLHGREVWRTQGSEASTVMVADIDPAPTASSTYGGLRALGNFLYFRVISPTSGIWRISASTGVAQAVPELTFVPEYEHGGHYYAVTYSNNQSILTTSPVAALQSRSAGRMDSILQAEDGSLYGFAETGNGSPGTVTMYVYRISEGNSQLVEAVATFQIFGEVSGASPGLVSSDGPIAYYSLFGSDLFRVDGTVSGSGPARDDPGLLAACLSPGISGSAWSLPCARRQSVIYAIGEDIDGLYGLHAIDQSGASRLISNSHQFVQGESSYGSPRGTVGGRFLFSNSSPPSGEELWSTDGTPEGTQLVKDINPGENSSQPGRFHTLGGITYFPATDGESGTELWTTDGTPAGTRRAFDLTPGPASGIDIHSDIVSGGGAIYCRAPYSQAPGGSGLWKITAAGPSFLPSINVGELSAGTDALYFTGRVSDTPLVDVWRLPHDSTLPTRIFESASTDPLPLNLLAGAGRVHFQQIFPRASATQWVGTAPDFSTISIGSTARSGTSWIAGQAFYVVEGGRLSASTGGQLVVLATFVSQPHSPSAAGQLLFFSGNTASAGEELWVSDGTPGGTRMLADIRPGAASSNATPGFWHEGQLFFTANDGVHGVECWKTDGTTGGTCLITDASPGMENSLPNPIGVINNQLIMNLSTPEFGTEVWAFDLAATHQESWASWRAAQLGGNLSQAVTGMVGDPDDDRLSNLMEYALGTSPLSGSNRNPINVLQERNRRVFTAELPPGRNDIQYIVEYSISLAGSWDEVPNETMLPKIRCKAPPGSTSGFFRLRVAYITQ